VELERLAQTVSRIFGHGDAMMEYIDELLIKMMERLKKKYDFGLDELYLFLRAREEKIREEIEFIQGTIERILD
jgi:hypothetical protein